ncbi:conserved protein of unknown function (plasmid) [Denitratisoma oestradiolicum]|uniref:Uncharacterized protein n=1 Tax=Denitratisoma oestradiolicum TaxID=311182 RepID=A0A6S6Y1Y3_9PROT|nr:conserved protein of unknown function [Denitratisoma oestradiolicum]
MASEAIITEELICKAAEQLAAEIAADGTRRCASCWRSGPARKAAATPPSARCCGRGRHGVRPPSRLSRREAAPQAVLDKVQGWATEM